MVEQKTVHAFTESKMSGRKIKLSIVAIITFSLGIWCIVKELKGTPVILLAVATGLTLSEVFGDRDEN